MRLQLLAATTAILGATACVDKATAPAPLVYHLSATITEANNCAVTVLDKNYQSNGMIRGDVPKAFVGTVPDKSYHGFGCWVATAGGDGDLVVLFSGNNLGKPLAVGSYTPSREILDETAPMHVQVRFQTSEIGTDKLVTMDDLAGSIVVEATPSGGRVIRINTDLVRWYTSF